MNWGTAPPPPPPPPPGGAPVNDNCCCANGIHFPEDEMGLWFTDGRGTVHHLDADLWSAEHQSPRDVALITALLHLVLSRMTGGTS